MIRNILIVSLLGGSLFAQQPVCKGKISAPSCGTQLAVWPASGGQPAFSNGQDQGTSCSCRGGTLYQCVNYVNQYYKNVMGADTSEWYANAAEYYSYAGQFGLDAFPNAGTTSPAVNDILVFQDGPAQFGHVAIIEAVSTTTVSIIEQNWSASGTATLSLQIANGVYTVGQRGNCTIPTLPSCFTPVGWLRLPGNALPNPIPAVTTLSPASLAAGATLQTLTIDGTGFLTTSSVTFDGVAHNATYVNADELTISLTTADLAMAGNYPVVVTNPSPGGGASPAANFVVTSNLPENEWTWMVGSDISGQIGVYGTIGDSARANVPGARDSAVGWTDSAGNFWLFGGEQKSGETRDFNDLWEFNPTSNEWTWVSGSNATDASGSYGTLAVASSTNVPPARGVGAISWTDHNDNLWLFGGYGGNGYLNDLWKFSLSSKQWTWMSGSKTAEAKGVYGTRGFASATSVPGARRSAVNWIDATGNLWIFGGDGVDSTGEVGGLNDLWEFNPSNYEWTWMGGSDTRLAAGVYGTKGVSSTTDVPGYRESAISWIDSHGNFWLFGGVGGSIISGDLNDLWEFNQTSKTWTWMAGNNSVNEVGIYGAKGVAATTNLPGARDSAVSWADGAGNFWLFGGRGMDSSNEMGVLNDLWKFSPSTKQWTWVNGNSTVDQNPNNCYYSDGVGEICAYPGVYGMEGTPAAGNAPGSRWSATTWTDSQGNLWMFGGLGIDSGRGAGQLNDLWRYTP